MHTPLIKQGPPEWGPCFCTFVAPFLDEYAAYGRRLGLSGQISGEHDIGLDKRHHYIVLTDPALLDLQRRNKSAFDPEDLFNRQLSDESLLAP